jgi:hypothetical protein
VGETPSISPTEAAGVHAVKYLPPAEPDTPYKVRNRTCTLVNMFSFKGKNLEKGYTMYILGVKLKIFFIFIWKFLK